MCVAAPKCISTAVKDRSVSLSHCECVVIDDAENAMHKSDKKKYVKELEKKLPAKSQRVIFASSWRTGLWSFAKHLLRDPIQINMGFAINPAIQQRFVSCEDKGKVQKLRQILPLKEVQSEQVVILSEEKLTREIAELVTKLGFTCASVSGKTPHHHNSTCIEEFSSKQLQVLVTTDMCHLQEKAGLANVLINVDFPTSIVEYIRRVNYIRDGICVSLLTYTSDHQVDDVIQLLKNSAQPIPEFLLKRTSI